MQQLKEHEYTHDSSTGTDFSLTVLLARYDHEYI